MKSIAVFCGSSRGKDPAFSEQARRLGGSLAEQGIRLVFGGSNVGLMQELANGALEAGGEVTGVMPRFLYDKGIAHTGLTRLVLVDTMHERKMQMNELCDGVIVLPGGFGTFDECFEMITWAQLGIHQKPIALLNVQGYYDPLLEMIRRMVDQGFLKDEHHGMLILSSDIQKVLDTMHDYTPTHTGKWINGEQ
ncbi:MAG: TIGR00730 family Rossman fold protein [Bacteroidales bacterium]